MKIFYIGRYKEKYSLQLLRVLRKFYKNVDVRWSRNKFQRIHVPIKKYHLIISFRNYYIFRKQELKLAKLAAINFHPSLPKYRGAGCSNLAIFNNDKYFGCTAHLMEPKIDYGKIINIKKFKIRKNITLQQLIEKTKYNQFIQAKQILKKISKNPNSLLSMIKKNKNIKWSKKIANSQYLDKLYNVNIHDLKKMNIKMLDRYFRSTIIKGYSPKININNYSFVYEDKNK